MKKITSILIAFVMLLSMTAAIIPAGATPVVHTLDAHNEAINVPYFSGTTNCTFVYGNATSSNKIFDDIGSINVSEKDGDGELNLDGTITEEEWGLPIIDVRTDYAATFNGTEPSAENTYFWHVTDLVTNPLDLEGPKIPSNGYQPDREFSYKVWMAWDEDYLYVAARVQDPDGPAANQPGKDIWDGDCLQFMIDPDGPNSVAGGSGYDPAEDPAPWLTRKNEWCRDPEDSRLKIRSSKVANIGMGYLGGNLGGPEVFDMEDRYFPEYTEVLASGVFDYMTVDWKGYDVLSTSFDTPEGEDPKADNPLAGEKYAYASILPVSNGDGTYETTYEAAIPWELVSGSYTEFDCSTRTETIHLVEPDPKAGDEYGLSLVVLNRARGNYKQYNSWLTWGSGVCGAQTNTTDYPTAGGSNSMVLVSDELGTTGCSHTFAAPTCSAPYVCTKCGYDRGFAVGHNYSSSLVTALDATTDGVITSTCAYCGDVVTATAEAVAQDVYYEFDGTLTTGALDPHSEWCQENWNYTYKDENGNSIFNPDGSNKKTYTPYEGEMVFDLTDHAAGTYFATNHSQTSFAYKYDVRLTGADINEVYDSLDTNYTPGLYNWFGGVYADKDPEGNSINRYGMNYAAGFFPTTLGSTSGTFRIMEAKGGGVIDGSNQKIVSESAVIDLGTGWHEFLFVFDEEECAAFFYLDGDCVAAAWDAGMSTNGHGQVPLMRKFNISCMIKGMGIGSTTAFFEAPADFEVTCDGTVIGRFAPGATVELPVPANKTIARFAARFYTWEGESVSRGLFDENNDTANKRTYTMVMPAHDVTLTSRFVVIGDTDGTLNTDAKDVARLKKIVVGSVNVSSTEFEAADVNLDGAYDAKDIKALKGMI